MQKFCIPMVLSLGLLGCQSYPTITQSKPTETIPPSKRPPVICTMQYDPVCATINHNGVIHQQTFGNKCATANTDNIVTINPGECGTATTH